MAFTQTMYPSSSSASVEWADRTNVHGNTPSTFTSEGVPKTAVSDPLTVTNYGFSIPSDATITNVSFDILKSNTEGTVDATTDSVVNIIVAGTTRTVPNLADTTTLWPIGAPTVATYSASAATWGGLTPAQANASNTGLTIVVNNNDGTVVTAEVYTISCTITYTLPEFFMKAWNGSAWVTGSLRRWNGSAWDAGLEAQVKIWDGSAWVAPP